MLIHIVVKQRGTGQQTEEPPYECKVCHKFYFRIWWSDSPAYCDTCTKLIHEEKMARLKYEHDTEQAKSQHAFDEGCRKHESKEAEKQRQHEANESMRQLMIEKVKRDTERLKLQQIKEEAKRDQIQGRQKCVMECTAMLKNLQITDKEKVSLMREFLGLDVKKEEDKTEIKPKTKRAQMRSVRVEEISGEEPILPPPTCVGRRNNNVQRNL